VKITKEALQKIINECVNQKIDEMAGIEAKDSPLSMRDVGIRWDNMKFLNAKDKLSGRWAVIMKAYEESGEDEEKTLYMLKSATGTLERNKAAKPPAPPVEMASQEELTDFSKL
jgi:hypothetical protein